MAGFGESAGWSQRALTLLRPGVEALLLAGVALGCVQALWAAAAPQIARASDDGRRDGASVATAATASAPAPAEILSPFAPDGSGFDAATHAVEAALAQIQLAGLRATDDPHAGGAVLILEGGAQRAFSAGQEVAPGVVLADVRVDGVTLAHAGGARRLTLPAPQRVSSADLLLGRTPVASQDAPGGAAHGDAAPVAPPPAAAIAQVTPFAPAAPRSEVTLAPDAPADLTAQTAPLDVVAPRAISAAAGPDAASWFAQTLTQLEQRDGAPVGWRLGAEPPAAIAASGLGAGDLVVSIAGVGPADAIGLARIAATQPETLDLVVERVDGRRETVRVRVTGAL